jgi:hypothetical protein
MNTTIRKQTGGKNTKLRSEFRVVKSYYTSLRSEFRVVLSYYTSLRSEFRVVMSVTISA